MSFYKTKEQKQQLAAGGREFEELTRLTNELITTQRQLHKQGAELRRLNEKKNLALGIVAHDLRNPLALIKMQSELLLNADEVAVPASHRELLESIHQQGQLMLSIVNDLLDVAAIEAGRFSINRSDVNVVSELKRLVQSHALLAAQQATTIRFLASSDNLVAQVDVNKFQQVIANLIGNAVKYSPPGAVVEVTLSESQNAFKFCVRDQGPGIPADKLETLFQPFTTAGVATTSGEKSTGLGLAIVRRIVEKHDGTIRVTSTLGEGTCFTVQMPRVLPVDSSTAPAETQPIDADSHDLPTDLPRVLIVDDYPAAAKLIAKMLASLCKTQIEFAYDGESALERFDEFQPQIVLLDIELPDLSGREVASRIRERHSAPTPMLCALTAHGQCELESIASSGVFDEVLAKPVSINDLRRLLRRTSQMGT